MGRTLLLPGNQPPNRLPLAALSHPHTGRTWGPSGWSHISKSFYPVPLSLLSSSDSVDGSGAERASVCPPRGSLMPFLFGQLSLVTSHKTPYLLGLWEEFKSKTSGRPRPTGRWGTQLPALADKLRLSTSHNRVRRGGLRGWQGRPWQRCGPSRLSAHGAH